MKITILILFLAVSLSFDSSTKELPTKYVKVSDKLDMYRIRDNHNLNEFDKKVNIILTNTDE